MIRPTLIAAAAVAWTVAVVYAYVGFRLLERRPGHDATKRALLAFASWWWILAGNIAIGGAMYLAAGFGFTSLPLQVTWAHVERLLLVASLVGLTYYLIYVLWGRSFPLVMGTYYTVYYALLLYALARAEPIGIHIGAWRTDLVYANDDNGVLTAINGLLLLGPPVGLCLFGLVVAARRRLALEPIHRYRFATVCGALIVWWIVAVVAGQRVAMGYEAFQFVNRFLGLAAALVILMAYRPPAWIRSRLGTLQAA